jgi:hypothetical protein
MRRIAVSPSLTSRIAAAGLVAVSLASAAQAQTFAWSQVFNGPSEPPAGAATGSTEDPRAVATDASGNIFAGGVTQRFENVAGTPGLKSVPHDDFVIIKYTATGQQLWTGLFDFPTEGDNQDSPTTRSGVDSMSAMVATPDAGVVAAGRATTRYSGDGLFGFTQAGVVKFDAGGEVSWYQLLGDPTVSSLATTLIGDGGFGLYVGGASALNTSQQDSFVTLLDGAGVPIWTANANFPSSQIIQIVRDPASACVALAGISGGGAKVVRISAGGSATLQSVPALGEGSTGVGLTLTSDGGVIVTGNAAGNVIVAKIDATGTQVWNHTWRMGDGRSVIGRGVQIDATGVVRIGGHTGSAAGNPADFFVATFDAGTGQFMAARTIDTGLGLAESSARMGVTIEPSGRTLIAGQTPTGVPGDNDFAVAVFDAADAARDWTARWSNASNPTRDDRASVITPLSTGDIAVIGRSDGGATGIDLATLVLTPPVFPAACDSIDFNNNGAFPEDQDVIDFFTVLAGGDCSTNTCNDIDFNNNGAFPEDQDVISFFNVLAGGEC